MDEIADFFFLSNMWIMSIQNKLAYPQSCEIFTKNYYIENNCVSSSRKAPLSMWRHNTHWANLWHRNKCLRIARPAKAPLPEASLSASTAESLVCSDPSCTRPHGESTSTCLWLRLLRLPAWSWLFHGAEEEKGEGFGGSTVDFGWWHIYCLHTKKRGLESWSFFSAPLP